MTRGKKVLLNGHVRSVFDARKVAIHSIPQTAAGLTNVGRGTLGPCTPDEVYQGA